MNGLSDVRLTLQGSELESGSRQRLTAKAAAQPGHGSRWKLFVRRLTTRRALLELSDAQLKDIGLSREQAKAEAHLPFWRL